MLLLVDGAGISLHFARLGAMSNETPTAGRKSRIIRLSVIGLMLAVALFCLVVLRYQICEPSTVFEANGMACRGPNLTDAVTLVFFAGIVALLWPDLAEFGLFGFSVKRKADEALDRAESAQVVAGEAATTVYNVRLDQVLGDSLPTVSTIDAALAAAMAQVSDEGHASPAQSSDGRVGRVIRLWSELVARLTLDPGDLMRGRKVDGWLEADPTRPEKQRFIESHITELKRVREVRNSAAHAVTVSDESLDGAITIATELLAALTRQGL